MAYYNLKKHLQFSQHSVYKEVFLDHPIILRLMLLSVATYILERCRPPYEQISKAELEGEGTKPARKRAVSWSFQVAHHHNFLCTFLDTT